MRTVEIRQRFKNQPQYTELWVNGYMLGEYINGKDKKYLNPEKWADEMVKKRTKVLERNIARLEQELEDAQVELGLIQER